MKVSAEQFNEDYYIRGISTHKSGYENHHYIPTRSYEEAIEFGDSSFEGHYFFNKGNILAKDSTVITIKVEPTS